MLASHNNVQNLDDPVPTGPPAADPAKGIVIVGKAESGRSIDYEKFAIWIAICVVPWVVIALAVWAIYG